MKHMSVLIRANLLEMTILGVILVAATGCPTGIPKRSVNSMYHLRLGGVDQAVLERGANERLPLLLWLHGGPGSAQMPIAHRYNTDLEEVFIVVHWDQRGAGKSNPKGFDPDTMTLRQFVNDAHELTLYLKKKYQQDRIYLLGHSWGTKFGLLLARDHSEDYHAFIAVGQVVDPRRAHTVAYRWLREQLQDHGHVKALKKLDRLGLPPFENHDTFVDFMGMVDSYGGGMDEGFMQLLWAALTSPYYHGLDYFHWLGGAKRGSGPMWESYSDFSAIQQVPRLNLPAYFISGSRDMNTPVELVREYYEALDAPFGKRLYIIDGAGHAPFLGNPSEFTRILKEIDFEVRKIPR
jgi:pimeloyl-ACP methyl ester carboxylesterase